MDEDDDYDCELEELLEYPVELEDGSKVTLGELVDSLMDLAILNRTFLAERELEKDFEEWSKRYERRTLN